MIRVFHRIAAAASIDVTVAGEGALTSSNSINSGRAHFIARSHRYAS